MTAEEKAPAVVAYVLRNGLLLSVTRKDTGEHAVPGGKAEPDETLEKALERELFEETGLRLVSWELVSEGIHDSGRRVFAYRVIADGDPVAKEEGTRVEWVSPETIARGFGSSFHSVALWRAGLI